MNLLNRPSGRVLLFTLLYATEGAPIGFIWWALPTLLRAQGVPVEDITRLMAILVLPWVFKFLWAPLVDSLRSPRWGFRLWIMGPQLLMGLTLLPLLYLAPAEDFSLLTVLLLAHAVSAATQDVSIDALAINALDQHEYGAINGYMQAGMLLGRSIFGGGALLVAHLLGWQWIFIGLIACVWASLFLLLFVREPPPRNNVRSGFGPHLGAALKNRRTWLGLLFALIAAAGFEAAGALAGPYLIDRQLSAETIGFFFAVPVVVVTLIGGLVGGKISDRLGRTKTVGAFLIGFAVTIMGLGSVDGFYGDTVTPTLLLGILLVMYFFIGLFTASSYALFMDLTDPRLGATQFSTFMAATNGCESWSTWAGGRIAAGDGYPVSFFVMSVISLLSLPLLKFLAAGADETIDCQSLHQN